MVDGRSGAVAHGLLKDFGLREGAVGSSVGHDAHNIILAGTNEAEMQLALRTIRAMRGGVCVVRGGRVESLEGDWQPERIVVLEFENMETAKNWLESPEYRPARNLRHKSAVTRSILVEGFPS